MSGGGVACRSCISDPRKEVGTADVAAEADADVAIGLATVKVPKGAWIG